MRARLAGVLTPWNDEIFDLVGEIDNFGSFIVHIRRSESAARGYARPQDLEPLDDEAEEFLAAARAVVKLSERP